MKLIQKVKWTKVEKYVFFLFLLLFSIQEDINRYEFCFFLISGEFIEEN